MDGQKLNVHESAPFTPTLYDEAEECDVCGELLENCTCEEN